MIATASEYMDDDNRSRLEMIKELEALISKFCGGRMTLIGMGANEENEENLVLIFKPSGIQFKEGPNFPGIDIPIILTKIFYLAPEIL